MKTVINIKTDKDIKEKAQKIAKELGMPLSTVVNASLKQFVRNKEVYFSLASEITTGLESILSRADKDIVSKTNISPAFRTAEDAIKYLHS